MASLLSPDWADDKEFQELIFRKDPKQEQHFGTEVRRRIYDRWHTCIVGVCRAAPRLSAEVRNCAVRIFAKALACF